MGYFTTWIRTYSNFVYHFVFQSDSYLEEHPVIQALVDQIVHLEDHIAVELEKRAKHEEEFEALVRKCDNMSGHIVILQHKIKFVENKVSVYFLMVYLGFLRR